MKKLILINATDDCNVLFISPLGHKWSFKSYKDTKGTFPINALENLLKHLGVHSLLKADVRVAYSKGNPPSMHHANMLANLGASVMYTDKLKQLSPTIDRNDPCFFFYHNKPSTCENKQLLLPFPEDAFQVKQR